MKKQPVFEADQLVYDAQGNPGRYIRGDNLGHVVRPYVTFGVHEYDGGYLGEPEFWPQVFRSNPYNPNKYLLMGCLAVAGAILLVLRYLK